MSIAHTIVYKDAGAYSCFPDVVRLACGELCVTFRCVTGFSLDALRPGKFDHVDRRARIALSRSRDDGVTWGSPNVFPPFDAECGEQDPSITQLLDGSLMINFFRWRVVSAQEKGRLAHPTLHLHDGSWSDAEGPWVIRSRDGGAHWETTPVRVDSSPLHRASTSDAVVELANGTLLMPVYSIRPGSPAHLAYVVRSIDGGETWGEPAIIAHDPAGRISFEEPALVQTRQGHLLAMLRAGEPGTYEYLHQAISHDEGRTWTDLHETPMWGHPAHLLQLSDGRLLCAYGHRRSPFGVRACLSCDGGQSWDIAGEIVLRDDGASRDVGYPSSVELPNGHIVTVYYIHGEDDIRHIAATRWRAPD